MSGQAAQTVRVCFVIENLLRAGTELWILRLIERLDRQRVQPLLCVVDGDSPDSRQLEPTDCPVLRLGLSNLKTVRTVSAASRLFRFLRHHQVDVVQVHHADPFYLGVPVARLANVSRVVQTKYDVGYWLKGADLWLHRMMRRWVDLTIANCEACRQAAIEQEWSSPQKIVVLDNGIDLAGLRQIPPMVMREQASLRIGILANLRPVKDVATFLRAARHLLDTRRSLSFHVIGDGDQRPALEQLALDLGIDRQVVFHGHVSNPQHLIGQMSIGTLCSLSEGLPHALLEFMAAGRPVVASRVGGNAEIIEDGRTGRLVPPQDPRALSDAWGDMIDHPTETFQMGVAARESVVDRFSLIAMTHRFELFYQKFGRSHSINKRVQEETLV
ncbi:MAG: glycosyltransferase [Pirellulaceae bacterium]|nr:glycosyltransferase [Pirellulaceae bacterium]